MHVPSKTPKTLIVGQSPIDKVTEVRLKKKGITYLDRQSAKSKEGVDRFVKSLKTETQEALLSAVRLRLRPGDTVSDTTVSKEFMRSLADRNSANMAQVSTYFPSELSAGGYGKSKGQG